MTELNATIIEKIIEVYNGSDETVSLFGLAGQFGVDYINLIDALKPRLEEIKLKTVRCRLGDPQFARRIPMGDHLLDYRMLMQCSLSILAETFGYTDNANCQRVLRKAHPDFDFTHFKHDPKKLKLRYTTSPKKLDDEYAPCTKRAREVGRTKPFRKPKEPDVVLETIAGVEITLSDAKKLKRNRPPKRRQTRMK